MLLLRQVLIISPTTTKRPKNDWPIEIVRNVRKRCRTQETEAEDLAMNQTCFSGRLIGWLLMLLAILAAALPVAAQELSASR